MASNPSEDPCVKGPRGAFHRNGVLTYSFARIGAALALKSRSLLPAGKRWWLRLHGGVGQVVDARRQLLFPIVLPQCGILPDWTALGSVDS